MKKIALFFMLLASNALASEVGEVTNSEGPESCNLPGRYQIYTHKDDSSNSYLLDTCLGRLWKLGVSKEGDKIHHQALFPIYRLNNYEDKEKWTHQQLDKIFKKSVKEK